MHLNICSLLPKIAELTAYVYTPNLDILVISESWLKKSIPNSAIYISGYNIFRQDRISNGGGLLSIVGIIYKVL